MDARVALREALLQRPHEIEVETKDGKKLVRFEKAIIAAGSQAVKLPGFPWTDKRMMDSTDALELA
ncbi:MAG TPA: hypothetical protein VH375_03095, partial [Rhodanobacteraceae bacterium]